MRTLGAAVAVVLGLGAAARADEAAKQVTLEEALDAVGQAPAHQSAIARADASAADVPAAEGWPATSVGVASSLRTAHLIVTASVPLPILGAAKVRKAARATARADRDVAIAETAVTDHDLRRAVTRAWLELARAEAHAEASARAVERQAALAKIAAERLDAGDVPRAEVVQAEAVTRKARARAATELSAIEAASADLAAVLGWEPSELLHTAGALPAVANAPGLDELRARRGAHPSLRVEDALVGAADARVGEAKASRWPVISFDAEASIDDPTLPGSDLRLGLTLELPLLGKHAAGQHAAEAHRRAARAERDATDAALDGAIVAAYRRFEAARDSAATLDDDVVPAQREAAALAQDAYREGAGDLASVLEAERSLAETEDEATDARIDAALAQAELSWSVGTTP